MDKDKVMELVKCQLCGKLAQRAVTVKCCASIACSYCAVTHIGRNRKCWNCENDLANSELINDDLTRKIVRGLKDDIIPTKTEIDEFKASKKKFYSLKTVKSRKQLGSSSSEPSMKTVPRYQSSLSPAGPKKRSRTKFCRRCKEYGHIFKECPQSKKAKLTKRLAAKKYCFKCQQRGHAPKNCPGIDDTYMSNEDAEFSCYNCEQVGHIAKDCPEPKMKKNKRFGSKVSRYDSRSVHDPDEDIDDTYMSNEDDVTSCYNCEQIGHLARDCPEPITKNEYKASTDRLGNVSRYEPAGDISRSRISNLGACYVATARSPRYDPSVGAGHRSRSGSPRFRSGSSRSRSGSPSERYPLRYEPLDSRRVVPRQNSDYGDDDYEEPIFRKIRIDDDEDEIGYQNMRERFDNHNDIECDDDKNDEIESRTIRYREDSEHSQQLSRREQLGKYKVAVKKEVAVEESDRNDRSSAFDRLGHDRYPVIDRSGTKEGAVTRMDADDGCTMVYLAVQMVCGDVNHICQIGVSSSTAEGRPDITYAIRPELPQQIKMNLKLMDYLRAWEFSNPQTEVGITVMSAKDHMDLTVRLDHVLTKIATGRPIMLGIYGYHEFKMVQPLLAGLKDRIQGVKIFQQYFSDNRLDLMSADQYVNEPWTWCGGEMARLTRKAFQDEARHNRTASLNTKIYNIFDKEKCKFPISGLNIISNIDNDDWNEATIYQERGADLQKSARYDSYTEGSSQLSGLGRSDGPGWSEDPSGYRDPDGPGEPGGYRNLGKPTASGRQDAPYSLADLIQVEDKIGKLQHKLEGLKSRKLDLEEEELRLKLQEVESNKKDLEQQGAMLIESGTEDVRGPIDEVQHFNQNPLIVSSGPVFDFSNKNRIPKKVKENTNDMLPQISSESLREIITKVKGKESASLRKQDSGGLPVAFKRSGPRGQEPQEARRNPRGQRSQQEFHGSDLLSPEMFQSEGHKDIEEGKKIDDQIKEIDRRIVEIKKGVWVTRESVELETTRDNSRRSQEVEARQRGTSRGYERSSNPRNKSRSPQQASRQRHVSKRNRSRSPAHSGGQDDKSRRNKSKSPIDRNRQHDRPRSRSRGSRNSGGQTDKSQRSKSRPKHDGSRRSAHSEDTRHGIDKPRNEQNRQSSRKSSTYLETVSISSSDEQVSDHLSLSPVSGNEETFRDNSRQGTHGKYADTPFKRITSPERIENRSRKRSAEELERITSPERREARKRSTEMSHSSGRGENRDRTTEMNHSSGRSENRNRTTEVISTHKRPEIKKGGNERYSPSDMFETNSNPENDDMIEEEVTFGKDFSECRSMFNKDLSQSKYKADKKQDKFSSRDKHGDSLMKKNQRDSSLEKGQSRNYSKSSTSNEFSTSTSTPPAKKAPPPPSLMSIRPNPPKSVHAPTFSTPTPAAAPVRTTAPYSTQATVSSHIPPPVPSIPPYQRPYVPPPAPAMYTAPSPYMAAPQYGHYPPSAPGFAAPPPPSIGASGLTYVVGQPGGGAGMQGQPRYQQPSAQPQGASFLDSLRHI